MVKVLVCGGREYADPFMVAKVLEEVRPDLIITGAAPGADTLAESWARRNGVPYRGYPANWKRDGKPGGPIRNRAMLAAEREGLDLVVAFPGGNGTADMVWLAHSAGVKVREVQR